MRSPKKAPRPTLVYFIQSGDSSSVKVGLTDNLPERLRDLQCGNPEVLKLLGVVPGDKAVERLMHIKLTEHKIRGEWYKKDQALELLRSCKKIGILDQAITPPKKCQLCPEFLTKKARSPLCKRCRRKQV